MILQRTFSGFPTGFPGFALLLLRVVVGGAASSQAWLLISANHGAVNTSLVVALVAFVTGLALIIGLMTPIQRTAQCRRPTSDGWLECSRASAAV